MFADVAQVLEGGVDIAVEPGGDVGFHFGLDAEGAHLAEVLILRADDAFGEADHVLEVHIEAVDFDLQVACGLSGEVVKQTHIDACVAFG